MIKYIRKMYPKNEGVAVALFFGGGALMSYLEHHQGVNYFTMVVPFGLYWLGYLILETAGD